MTVADQHPDPITEGLAQTGQRLVQLITVAVVVRQIHVRMREKKQQAEQTRAHEDQRRTEQAERAAFDSARARWAPAHDRAWLAQAELLQVAHAWSAALPYAAKDSAAASAVRLCEERLRRLHPHAMSHYDRLREAGLPAEEAMRDAAPFFTHDPNVRTGYPASTLELTEGTGSFWAANEHGPHRSDWEDHRQQQRAEQLIAEIRDDCRARQLPEPTPAELRTALEITTNLPDRIIARAVHNTIDPDQRAEAPGTEHAGRKHAPHVTGAVDDPAPIAPQQRTRVPSDAQRDFAGNTGNTDAARARSASRPAHEVAADDFPYAIGESMRRAAEQPPQQPEPRNPRRAATDQPRRHRN